MVAVSPGPKDTTELEFGNDDFDSPISFGDPIGTSTPKRGNRRHLSFPREPIAILTTECCKKACFKNVSVTDLEVAEELLKQKNEADQLQFVLTNLWLYSKRIHTPGVRRIVVQHNLLLNGNSVCPEAWCLAHNCSQKRFAKCTFLFKKGVRSISHGNKGKRKMHLKGTTALAWMKHVFPRIGDFMPHKTQVNNIVLSLHVYN